MSSELARTVLVQERISNPSGAIDRFSQGGNRVPLVLGRCKAATRPAAANRVHCVQCRMSDCRAASCSRFHRASTASSTGYAAAHVHSCSILHCAAVRQGCEREHARRARYALSANGTIDTRSDLAAGLKCLPFWYKIAYCVTPSSNTYNAPVKQWYVYLYRCCRHLRTLLSMTPPQPDTRLRHGELRPHASLQHQQQPKGREGECVACNRVCCRQLCSAAELLLLTVGFGS